jgi:Na+/proline symporter
VATEISAVTIISVPATAYKENWEYLQFFIGSFASRFFIAAFFIPAFYKYNCTTIYEYLRHRFGPETQYTATVFFFITRLLGSGVRLTVAAMAVSVLIGWPLIPTIILFSIVAIVYISWGGIKAIVWTNVWQALTFIIGGLATLWFLSTLVNGGLPGILHTAYDAGKLRVMNWGPALSDPAYWTTVRTSPNIWWLAILNGFFGSMAARRRPAARSSRVQSRSCWRSLRSSARV